HLLNHTKQHPPPPSSSPARFPVRKRPPANPAAHAAPNAKTSPPQTLQPQSPPRHIASPYPPHLTPSSSSPRLCVSNSANSVLSLVLSFPLLYSFPVTLAD